VSQQNRHPSATFSAPGADDATIYFASKPDRARDGGFLRKNIKKLTFWGALKFGAARGHRTPARPRHLLHDDESDDYDCIGQPGCIGGYSNSSR
jgi:hypothetical protein